MDAESKALIDVVEILSQLEVDAVKRILKYAGERFQVKGVVPAMEEQAETSAAAKLGPFISFDELFDAANPTTGLEQVLVAAYWFQVEQGQDDLDSFQLNKELKNMGHQSGNITRDLESLKNRDPRLIVQVRKEGNTQQARKRYKLTRAGIQAVEKMIRSNRGVVEQTTEEN